MLDIQRGEELDWNVVGTSDTVLSDIRRMGAKKATQMFKVHNCSEDNVIVTMLSGTEDHTDPTSSLNAQVELTDRDAYEACQIPMEVSGANRQNDPLRNLRRGGCTMIRNGGRDGNMRDNRDRGFLRDLTRHPTYRG